MIIIHTYTHTHSHTHTHTQKQKHTHTHTISAALPAAHARRDSQKRAKVIKQPSGQKGAEYRHEPQQERQPHQRTVTAQRTHGAVHNVVRLQNWNERTLHTIKHSCGVKKISNKKIDIHNTQCAKSDQELKKSLAMVRKRRKRKNEKKKSKKRSRLMPYSH